MGGQSRLDRLEPVEIGGQRQIGGFRFVAAAIGLQAFRETGARNEQRTGSAGIEGVGMAAQISEQRLGLVLAEGGVQLFGGGLGQGLQRGNSLAGARIFLPDFPAFPGHFVGEGETAGAEGQLPAILVGQLGEARHRRVLDALGDHLVIAEQAAAAGARHVGEGDRRRIEGLGGRAVGQAGLAMAAGAIFREQFRPMRQVGQRRGHGGGRIGGQQIGGQRVRQIGDGARLGLGGNGLLQPLALFQQSRLGRIVAQTFEALVHIFGEFVHLGEFRVALDLAVLVDRPGIIGGEIIDQAPGHLGGRRGVGGTPGRCEDQDGGDREGRAKLAGKRHERPDQRIENDYL